MPDNCTNCGDRTILKTATGERQKRGWCTPCMAQYNRYHRVNKKTGQEFWAEPNTLYERTKYAAKYRKGGK
jgi:hypothetical protein